jgi:hypothetical protein
MKYKSCSPYAGCSFIVLLEKDIFTNSYFLKYNRVKIKYSIYLRGRVKFPIGGVEKIFSKPVSLILGRIWCDSKADSIVWMGEGGGSAFVQKIQH